MKAVLMTAKGGPEVLEVADIPTPSITEKDQVLVRLHAAGINPLDIKMREGVYPMANLPFVLGWEGAGVVEAIGDEVSTASVGDEVYIFHGSFGGANGHYAEYTLCSERNVALKPKSQSFSESAGSPLIFLTAWESLFERASLQAGQSVLIHAGAGGVGHVAIQLAVNAGATVYTTVGNADNAKFVKELGAAEAINYKQDNFVDVVNDLTKGQGVDVVLDSVGGETLQQSVSALKYYGDLVTLIKPGPDLDLAAARMKNQRIGFEIVLSPVLYGLVDEQLRHQQLLNQAAEMIDAGALSVHVNHELPLEDARSAHVQIDQGSAKGKIVLLC